MGLAPHPRRDGQILEARRGGRLTPRGEGLQRDVVGIWTRQPRPVGRIDASAVRDPERVQLCLPPLELGPMRASERYVVESWLWLIEGAAPDRPANFQSEAV